MTTRLEMLLTDITVGARARGDVGDVASLKRSITELGMLQPVGVRLDGTLVFGGRRLAAAKELGLASIPVVVTSDADDELTALRAEMEENVERLQLTAVEAATLRRRLRTLAAEQKKEARERPATAIAMEPTADSEGAPADETPAAEWEQPIRAAAPSVADLDAQLAQATGYSLTTLKRVERISEFTDCGDPDTEEAARDALKRIDAGAPVMPLLDQVLAIHRANTTPHDLSATVPGAVKATPETPAPSRPEEPAAETAAAASADALVPPAIESPVAVAGATDTEPSFIEPARVELPDDTVDDGTETSAAPPTLSPMLSTSLARILDAIPRATVADLETLDDVVVELERALELTRARAAELRGQTGGVA